MAGRSAAQIRAHYEIEKGLASRLMNASKAERRSLYTELYDELFDRVPDHPQVLERDDPNIERQRMLGQARFLKSLLQPGETYLELGPGVCSLARHIANTAATVYAVDVSRVVSEGEPFPENLEFVLSDGTSVPVPADSVDLAFSNQLMEHLHPDDAREQLENVYRAVKPGGVYFCITPSRLSGPHDVSQHFDDVATGFHLKEYTYDELERLFREVGFQRFVAVVGYRGWGFRCPLGPLKALERAVATLPRSLRKAIGRFPPIRLALGVKLIAYK